MHRIRLRCKPDRLASVQVPRLPRSIVQLGTIVKGYRHQPGIRVDSYKR